METLNFLSEKDPDLQLAKQLGAILNSGESFSSIQDPLIQKLLVFQKAEQTNHKQLSSDSVDIWDLINKETRPKESATISTLFRSPNNSFAWATAATVLIAAFIGIFWFTSLDQPTLIGQSSSTIETIKLSDGSSVSLRPNSSLFEVALSNSQRAYKLEGEAFFNVSTNINRPFSVTTNTGTITVLGTEFNVSTWGKVTNVFLEEGSVRLDLVNKNSVILKPGETASLSESGISTPVTADINVLKDWLDNTLILKSTTVTNIISELEHHYNVTIDITEMENTSEKITGSIQLRDLKDTLRDLSIILGGTFREISSNSFVFIPLN